MKSDIDPVEASRDLEGQSPIDIIKWTIDSAGECAICSTNFGPFESVILHMVTKVKSDLPIVWVDSGVMLPETYRFADRLTKHLHLNLKVFNPEMTEARRRALFGPIPAIDDTFEFNQFSQQVKLAPFRRALETLKPKFWITAIRREQTLHRQSLQILTKESEFGLFKVAPLLKWTEKQLESYIHEHQLPNEKVYYDPVKANERRECGLHTNKING